jgi:hypothetical protein
MGLFAYRLTADYHRLTADYHRLTADNRSPEGLDSCYEQA